jgi:hypothetical protein
MILKDCKSLSVGRIYRQSEDWSLQDTEVFARLTRIFEVKLTSNSPSTWPTTEHAELTEAIASNHEREADIIGTQRVLSERQQRASCPPIYEPLSAFKVVSGFPMQSPIKLESLSLYLRSQEWQPHGSNWSRRTKPVLACSQVPLCRQTRYSLSGLLMRLGFEQ